MSKFVRAQADDIKCHIHTKQTRRFLIQRTVKFLPCGALERGGKKNCGACRRGVTCVARLSRSVTRCRRCVARCHRDVTAESHICHTLSQAVATTVTLVTPCHRVSIHLSTCRQVDIYPLRWGVERVQAPPSTMCIFRLASSHVI